MVNADDPALRANRLALLAHAARGDEPRGRPVEAGDMSIRDEPRLHEAASMHAAKLVILGRDGIINDDRDDHVKSPEEWVPIPARSRRSRG